MRVFFETLKKRKMIIILVISVVLGITLIFSQYFGLFPLDDEFALDMLTYYTKDTFFNTISQLDKTARTSYLMIHLADYFFMFGFYQLIAIGIYQLIQKHKTLLYILFIPYLALIGDFIENIIMDMHLLIYPSQIEILGHIVGVFTFVKYISLYLSLILLFTIAIACVVKKRIKAHKVKKEASK